MTTSKLVYILGLALITGSSLVCVHGKQQQPSHDEIERIVNDTHSFMWKCPECHPGSGLNVQCGTSISIDIPIKCVPCVKGVNHSNTQDYSTCKSCKNCAKHENKTGECTLEEDTTECLGTCHKGFYMDKITGDCQPCSDCCIIARGKKYHEEQCEDSGLPPNQQCRQSNNCPHPTKPMTSPLPNDPDDEQGSQGTLKIVLIILGIFFFILLIAFLVLWRHYGWEQIKSVLTKWCCCHPRHVLPTEGNTVNLYVSDQFSEHDSEAALCDVIGNQLTEDGDVLTNLSSVSGAKTMRRPVFKRLYSVPVQTPTKSEISKSFSHPGGLNHLAKVDKVKEISNFKSSFKTPGAKKHTKKGIYIYTRVETEPPVIGNLHAERVERESFPTPTTSGEFVRFSMGADDFMAQEPNNETPAPTELFEIDDVPADLENHDKKCGIKPALGIAVPRNGVQSGVGSMVTDTGKERLEKPSVTDQCTSRTELHLSSTTILSNIPQDFLDCSLSKRMSAIPIVFRRNICMMLDTPHELSWCDYRLLAEEIGLATCVISWLTQQNNKTELILQEFDAQKDPSIRRFKAILEKMKRNDVVTVIEEWLLHEWNTQNNNSPSVL